MLQGYVQLDMLGLEVRISYKKTSTKAGVFFLILKGNDEEGGGLPPKCLGKHASSTCFSWRGILVATNKQAQ